MTYPPRVGKFFSKKRRDVDGVTSQSGTGSFASGQPQHPCLAPPPALMHDDGAASDAIQKGGPRSSKAELVRIGRKQGVVAGLIPTFGRFGEVTIGASFGGGNSPYQGAMRIGRTVLGAFDQKGAELDHIDLPPRTKLAKKIFAGLLEGKRPGAGRAKLFRSTTSGAYFFLDDLHRVVVPTLHNQIWFLTFHQGRFLKPVKITLDGKRTQAKGRTKLPDAAYVHPAWDPDDEPPHALLAALPVWPADGKAPLQDARAYWWVTNHGLVGVADMATGTTCVHDLNAGGGGESINNSFAVGPKGAFVASNERLYRFTYADGVLKKVWSKAYTPGIPTSNLGRLNPRGTGTTPTLLGGQYVVLCDGSPKMNLVLYRQSDGKELGRRALFGKGAQGTTQSGCENSVVVFRRTTKAPHHWRIVVGNTWGYLSPFEDQWKRDASTLGLEYVDVAADGSLKRAHTSKLDIGSAVPKASLERGLLYTYTPERTPGGKFVWSFIGTSLEDGEERYRAVVHRDDGYVRKHDNAWGTICLSPRGILVGHWRGAFWLRDRF